MRLSAYVYPWDLARLGVREVLADLADHGLDAVDLAGAYHSITTWSPRGTGQHAFSAPLGGVFFPTRSERYGRIRPAGPEDGDLAAVWPEVARRAPEYGLAVNAWTVALFAPWLVTRHPEVARVQAAGEVSTVLACPSAPDLREYLTALCGDLVDQFSPATVRLEALTAGFDYGWHRPRALAAVPSAIYPLLDLCFCAACEQRGRGRGIDVAGLRTAACRAIDDELAGRPATVDPAELEAFQRSALDSATELASMVADAVHAADRGCGVVVSGPNEPNGARGIDVPALRDTLDGVLVWSPLGSGAAIRSMQDGAPGLPLTAFFPPGFAFDVGSPEWLAELRAAIDHPVDELAVYHYGLLTAVDFAATIQVIRELVANPATDSGRARTVRETALPVPSHHTLER